MDAIHLPPVPLHARHGDLQWNTCHDYMLRMDDRLRELFILLHDERLLVAASIANVVAIELFGVLLVSGAWQFVHFVLHLPVAHVLLLHCVRGNVHREGEELHQVVSADEAGSAGTDNISGVGL